MVIKQKEIQMKMKYIMMVAVAGLISTSTYAVTIDFQSLEHIDASTVYHGPAAYTEDGYQIVNLSDPIYLGTFGTLEGRYTGSTAMFNDITGGITELSKIGGGTFDLLSIDLAELNGSSPADVTFVRDGGHTQTFSLDAIAFGAETFVFDAGFLNSTTVTWSQDANYHQFDNIVVIPEPASLAMIGLVSGCGIFIRRRFMW